MRWLRGIDNFPPIVIVHFALFFWQTALWVVQDQARAQWCERRISLYAPRSRRGAYKKHIRVGLYSSKYEKIMDDQTFPRTAYWGSSLRNRPHGTHPPCSSANHHQRHMHPATRPQSRSCPIYPFVQPDKPRISQRRQF